MYELSMMSADGVSIGKPQSEWVQTDLNERVTGDVAFPKRRLEIDNGDEPVPVYVVNPHGAMAGSLFLLAPSLAG